jgi:amidase
MSYEQASAIARKRRAASIAAFYTTPSWPESELPANLTDFALKSGYYTADELAIVQSEAEVILDKIKTRAWTSLDVAKAFCKASALAQELVNPTAIVFERK